MILTGTLINGISVIICASIGAIIKNKMPKRICDGVIKALSLCILYIGIDGALEGKNPLIAILSLTIGTVIGEIIDIDKQMNKLGSFLQARFSKGSQSNFAEGFVSGSLMICVGAWAITGAMDAGIRGDHSSFLAKAIVDGTSTLILATTLGFGVAFSGIVLIIYQGGLALLSSIIQPYLTGAVISELTCSGSLLIIAIALNMMGVTKIKVLNLLPAVVMPLIISYIIM